jgi:hypothetical protein
MFDLLVRTYRYTNTHRYTLMLVISLRTAFYPYVGAVMMQDYLSSTQIWELISSLLMGQQSILLTVRTESQCASIHLTSCLFYPCTHFRGHDALIWLYFVFGDLYSRQHIGIYKTIIFFCTTMPILLCLSTILCVLYAWSRVVSGTK